MKSKALIAILAIILCCFIAQIMQIKEMEKQVEGIHTEIQALEIQQRDIRQKAENIGVELEEWKEKTADNEGDESFNENDELSSALPDEYENIALVVMAESGNQSYEGKLLVAATIRNRAEELDATPLEVVTQAGQYSKAWQMPEGIEDWLVEEYEKMLLECRKAVYEVFVEEAEVPQVKYFANPALSTAHGYGWIVNNCTYVLTEGDHEFYK